MEAEAGEGSRAWHPAQRHRRREGSVGQWAREQEKREKGRPGPSAPSTRVVFGTRDRGLNLDFGKVVPAGESR